METAEPQGKGSVPPANNGRASHAPSEEESPLTEKVVGRLLAALQVALSADLSAAKREILDRITDVEDSVDIIARELARRRSI